MWRDASIKVVASASMDQLVRLGVLEGAAGVKKWSWSRGSTYSGLAMAEKTFPDAHPLWFTTRDTRTYSTMVAAARRILGSREEAEDLAQRIINGETLSAAQQGALHHTGRLLTKERRDLADPDSLDRARNILARHAVQRARDAIRSLAERTRRDPSQSVSLSPRPGDRDGRPVAPQVETPREKAEALTDALLGPSGGWVFDRLMAIWKKHASPSDIKYVEALFQGGPKTITDVAREFGVTGSRVSKAIKNLTQIAINVIQREDPDLLWEVSLQKEKYDGFRTASPSWKPRLLARAIQEAARQF